MQMPHFSVAAYTMWYCIGASHRRVNSNNLHTAVVISRVRVQLRCVIDGKPTFGLTELAAVMDGLIQSNNRSNGGRGAAVS